MFIITHKCAAVMCKMDAMHTEFVTSALLRCTQDLSWMYSISLAHIKALVSASWQGESQKKVCDKLRTSQETALKVQNSQITDLTMRS